MNDYIVNENGIDRPATPEEVAQIEQLIKEAKNRQPSPDQVWKTEIEAALIELAAMLGGGA